MRAALVWAAVAFAVALIASRNHFPRPDLSEECAGPAYGEVDAAGWRYEGD